MEWKTVAFFSAFALLFLSACQNAPAGEGSSRQKSAVLTAEEQEAFLEKGTDITTATFSALSGKLKSALQEQGVAGAVNYCKLAAYPLVDSLSMAYDAGIRRTSLKARNPRNKPAEAELPILQAYHNQEANGQALLPQVVAEDANTVAFYAPIIIQPLCLQCHGRLGETLKEEDYAVIRELYPEDEAIGYQAGNLRGMWSVTFRR